jgi:hypothetical protein
MEGVRFVSEGTWKMNVILGDGQKRDVNILEILFCVVFVFGNLDFDEIFLFLAVCTFCYMVDMM